MKIEWTITEDGYCIFSYEGWSVIAGRPHPAVGDVLVTVTHPTDDVTAFTATPHGLLYLKLHQDYSRGFDGVVVPAPVLIALAEARDLAITVFARRADAFAAHP
jgi:hypothetical protein